MSELKPLPCPFCGWGRIVDGGFLHYKCTCSACGASTKEYPTWELAVEAWNHAHFAVGKPIWKHLGFTDCQRLFVLNALIARRRLIRFTQQSRKQQMRGTGEQTYLTNVENALFTRVETVLFTRMADARRLKRRRTKMEKISELINVKRLVCGHKIYVMENKKADLNTMTPEEILNDYAECPDLFEVGQTKDITLKNGDKAILVISDFNHYEMEDGTKAPITFNFFTLIGRDRHMNDKLTNHSGWEACGMRKFLNGEFLEAFPDEWRPFLASVKIVTGHGEDNELTETFDKIFLNSEIEVLGRTVWGREGEGHSLALFKDWRKRIIGYYGKETGWRYWLRSPASGYRGGFCNITSQGRPSFSYDNYAVGVAPCFCLAK